MPVTPDQTTHTDEKDSEISLELKVKILEKRIDFLEAALTKSIEISKNHLERLANVQS